MSVLLYLYFNLCYKSSRRFAFKRTRIFVYACVESIDKPSTFHLRIQLKGFHGCDEYTELNAEKYSDFDSEKIHLGMT